MGKIALRSEKRSVHQKENGEGKGVRETTTTLKGGQKNPSRKRRWRADVRAAKREKTNIRLLLTPARMKKTHISIGAPETAHRDFKLRRSSGYNHPLTSSSTPAPRAPSSSSTPSQSLSNSPTRSLARSPAQLCGPFDKWGEHGSALEVELTLATYHHVLVLLLDVIDAV